MGLAELLVVAFANYLSIMDNYTAYHRVGRNVTKAFNRKVEAALHKYWVHIHAGENI